MRADAAAAGELRFRLRCIDKLRYRFRGDESLVHSKDSLHHTDAPERALAEALELLPPFRPFLSYNFAGASR